MSNEAYTRSEEQGSRTAEQQRSVSAADSRKNEARNSRSNGRRRHNNSGRRGNANTSAAVDPSSANNTENRSAMNDISWYAKYPILLDAASRIQFMRRPGDYLGTGGVGKPEEYGRDIPGIMRIEYQAAIGTSRDNASPASICAKGIYDKIRDAYSGSLQAQPADIFMYMMHLDQFQAYIAWLKRIYGVLNFYTPYNYYAPLAMFRSMFPHAVNVTASTFYEWVSRKNDLYNYINQLVYMVNKYVVPSEMAIFDRHRWMNEYMYQDANSPLAQMYVFAPTGFWFVDGVDVENGTECNFVQLSSSNVASVEAAFRFGINMYTALADWGDAKTINGYIMRAFDGAYYPPCELMPIDYVVRPVYVPEVLLQIHNLRVFPEYLENAWRQRPETQAILSLPQNVNYNLNSPELDIPMDVPDQATITIASRLTPCVIQLDERNYDMHCGTEVVTGLYMTQRQDASVSVDDTAFRDVSRINCINYLDDASRRMQYVAQNLFELSAYAAFDMAPVVSFLYNEAGTGADSSHAFETKFGSMYNVTTVDSSVMARLHLVCQQSEFNIYNARAI